MRRYVASGLTGTPAAAIDNAVFGLWVPAGARRVGLSRVTFIKWESAGSALAIALRRTTTQGTPGSTITPTIVNDFNRDLAPTSGALLGMALYSVQPTVEALNLYGVWLSWGPGSSFQWNFDPLLWINPNAGVAVVASTAAAVGPGRLSVEFYE